MTENRVRIQVRLEVDDERGLNHIVSLDTTGEPGQSRGDVLKYAVEYCLRELKTPQQHPRSCD